MGDKMPFFPYLLNLLCNETNSFFRYIQGAPITGGSNSTLDENTSGNTKSDGEESLPGNGNTKYVPAGPTFRARFVGQGYKQVNGNISFLDQYLPCWAPLLQSDLVCTITKFISLPKQNSF